MTSLFSVTGMMVRIEVTVTIPNWPYFSCFQVSESRIMFQSDTVGTFYLHGGVIGIELKYMVISLKNWGDVL